MTKFQFTRRNVCKGLVTSLATIGSSVSAFALKPNAAPGDEFVAAAMDMLASSPSVDIHSHASRFFIEPDFVARGTVAATQMLKGKVDAMLICGVSDYPLLEFGKGVLVANRQFRPGEAIAEYHRQIAALKRLVGETRFTQALNAEDILRAKAAGRPSAMFAMEGADFIEDDLSRIDVAWQDGVRSITVIHYNGNQIGDPQTGSAVHDGLSRLGKSILRAIAKRGILIDLSHASLDAVRQATAIVDRPMILSHSNINLANDPHPRLVSAYHAQLVTRAGGVIGVQTGGPGVPDFAALIDRIFRTVDAVGIDHVAIGTDMDYTPRPLVPEYGNWPLIPAGLLQRGMSRAEVSKIVGGNFMRVIRVANKGDVQ